MAISRRKAALLTLVLLGAFVLSGCDRESGAAGEAPATAEITGLLLLAPGQSMPAGMPLEVELKELAPAAATERAAPIASATLESGDEPEMPFSLQYDTARVRSGTQYVLAARAAIAGTTYLAGSALAPVAGAGSFPVDVVLRRPPNASPLYLDVSVLRLDYKGESDWSGKLRVVMPGMLACLRSVSGDGLGVSKAWPMGGGRIGVRIRAADGNGFECVALADGSKFESLSGLPSFAGQLPGEGNPLFVPAPASPEMAECRRYERVLGGVNETLGWLVYDTCAPPPPPPEAAAPHVTPPSS